MHPAKRRSLSREVELERRELLLRENILFFALLITTPVVFIANKVYCLEWRKFGVCAVSSQHVLLEIWWGHSTRGR